MAPQTIDEYPSVAEVQPISIHAWAEDVPLAVSGSAINPVTVRGTRVEIAIPLDDAPTTPARHVRAVRHASGTPNPATRPGIDDEADEAPSTAPRRKLLRRDSLDRREALLKGKEGSRRRQRWENGSLRPFTHT